ncbi:hypothetical protein ACKI2C_52115, partial [Streptomyces brasiliscabiei]|uniref:hypothetical protein n=1 Tax=Streptomyces brasiliscabiei TaxID=2736302 RepID=UPI0038F7F320
GAAYVPVDADDPDERARLVFGEARVRGVITGAGEFTAEDPDRGEHEEAVGLFAGAAPHPSTHAIVAVPPPGEDDDAWI